MTLHTKVPCVGLLLPPIEAEYLYKVEERWDQWGALFENCVTGRVNDRVLADQTTDRLTGERDAALWERDRAKEGMDAAEAKLAQVKKEKLRLGIRSFLIGAAVGVGATAGGVLAVVLSR